MKIGVIGGGVVGNATARAWLEHCEDVMVYDTDQKRRTHDFVDVVRCDVVCVCVPTPMREDGTGIDTRIVDSVLHDVAVIRSSSLVAVRSTVPVGYSALAAKKYKIPNLIHWPEFLTARCAVTDAMMPTRNVIGTVDGVGEYAYTPFSRQVRVRWPSVPFYQGSSEESEFVKLATNAFFATKVAFWNEARRYAEQLGNGVDWEWLMTAILSDGRIHPSHTQVPGPDGQTGFGGTCLPKDLREFIDGMDSIGLQNGVCRAAWERNQYIDRLIANGGAESKKTNHSYFEVIVKYTPMDGWGKEYPAREQVLKQFVTREEAEKYIEERSKNKDMTYGDVGTPWIREQVIE